MSRDDAKLYYLYLLHNQPITYRQEQLFSEICGRQLHLSREDRDSVIRECKASVYASSDAMNAMIRNEIYQRHYAEPSELARVIWNLVRLGYAGTCYSERSKEYVGFLLKEWGISSEIYQEMLDTADTAAALRAQREWIENHPDAGNKNVKLQDIDANIGMLLADLDITIKELDMFGRK